MDPDQVRELQQRIQAALDAGASEEDLNEALSTNENVPFSSVREVRFADPEGGRDFRRHVADEAVTAASDFSLGFADEIAGLVEGIGAAVVPGGRGFSEGREEGTERFREREEEARERLGTKGQVASAIGTGLLGGAGTLKALQAARPALKGKGLLGVLSAGPKAKPSETLVRMAGRSTAGGAAVGAAEGAGRAEGGFRSRSEEALSGGLFGAGVGALGGAGIGAATQVPRAFSRARTAGSNIAEEGIRGIAGRARRPPSLLEEAQEAQQRTARRELIQPLEEAGDIPGDVADAFIENPVLQRELRSVARDNPSARRAVEAIDAAQEGSRRAVEVPDFETVDKVHQRLQSTVNQARRTGNEVLIRDVVDAYEDLDQGLRQMPGFSEFKDEWARTSQNLRALSEGRKLAAPNRSADDVRRAVKNAPSEEAEEFLMEGMANELAFKLERVTGNKSGTIRDILNSGKDFDQKLRFMFPDEQSWQSFQNLVELEAGSISFSERASVLAKAAAFLGGGTSVFAGLLPSP